MSDVKDVILMSADTPVMRINFSTLVYEVINENLLPFGVKGRICEQEKPTGNYRYDLSRSMVVARKNQEALQSWFSTRTLLLIRANAKWIYNVLNIDQVDSLLQRMRISFVCRSVSVLDKYWVKLDGDNATWDRIDVTRNHLNEVIAQIALHGKSLTLQGSLTTPELTTDGTYAKAWRRHEDGNLWLYKLGHNGNMESKIEVMCSHLLDKMNVRHVEYLSGEDDGKYVCMCKSMAEDDKSILPAMEFISYCRANGMDPDKEALRIDADGMYKMYIVDYLISNRDRHSRNWGFYYNPYTMDILCTHPLFDHNNAFDIELMKDPDAVYQVTGKTMRQSAKEALTKCDFKFTETFQRNDFITERQYDSFMWRAKDLGLL